jgi:hypothetical protein
MLDPQHAGGNQARQSGFRSDVVVIVGKKEKNQD